VIIMKVDQLMTRNVRACEPDDPLSAAAKIMSEQDCGCVPVVSHGDGRPTLVGMITDRDVCMAAYTQGQPLRAAKVKSAMTTSLCTCRPTDAISVALRVMRTNQLHRLPVVDADDHLVGILSLADVAREAAHACKPSGDLSANAVGETLEAIVQPRSAPREVVAV
jgi:CBS domain-containing protein